MENEGDEVGEICDGKFLTGPCHHLYVKILIINKNFSEFSAPDASPKSIQPHLNFRLRQKFLVGESRYSSIRPQT